MNCESIIKNIEIVYEDKNILAVNKPAGVVVHGGAGIEEKTLADWVSEIHPEVRSVGEPLKISSEETISRAGIVHRLDKETSGVLVIAKNQKAFLFLKKQFQDREVSKEYRAIVYGCVKEKTGIIDAPIGRNKKDFRLRSTDAVARGKLREATTLYTVLSRASRFSYLSLVPKTGRTHQLRIHLKSIGHPIVCDSLYAPRRECPSDLERLALHAHTLTIREPGGALLTLEAPLPEDFQKGLKACHLSLA